MVLLMLFLTYLLLGASIFYHIESRLEIDKVAEAREERIKINGELLLYSCFRVFVLSTVTEMGTGNYIFF